MSTQHKIEKDQDAPPGDPGSIYTQETLTDEKANLPQQTFPHPPLRPPQTPKNRWVLLGLSATIVIFSILGARTFHRRAVN